MHYMAENNTKKNFTEVSITIFISLKTVLVSKLCKKKLLCVKTNVYSFPD